VLWRVCESLGIYAVRGHFDSLWQPSIDTDTELDRNPERRASVLSAGTSPPFESYRWTYAA